MASKRKTVTDSQQTEGIAYQNKDIFSKYLAELYGQEYFETLGIKLPVCVSLERTELPLLEVNDKAMDNLLCLEDGSMAIIDYESKYSEENKVKYLGYIARLIKREYNQNRIIPKVHVVVVYTGDVLKGKTKPVLDFGDGNCRITEVFLTNWDADEILVEMKEKIGGGTALSVRDQLRLMMCPLSIKGREGKVETIRRCIEIIKTINDTNIQKRLFAGVLVFCDKVIEREDADRIRRYLTMTKVEQIFFEEQQEAVAKTKKETTIEVTRSTATKIAKNLLASGLRPEMVSKNTGLSLRTVKALAKEVEKEIAVV